MKELLGKIFDWHNPHNDACPQNRQLLASDCTCEQPIKKHKKSDFINRAYVKKVLLEETNARSGVKIFTCVKPSTLDEISAMVKREILKRAGDPPKRGKTL